MKQKTYYQPTSSSSSNIDNKQQMTDFSQIKYLKNYSIAYYPSDFINYMQQNENPSNTTLKRNEYSSTKNKSDFIIQHQQQQNNNNNNKN